MPEIVDYGLFVTASAPLIVTPGPDMMYVIALLGLGLRITLAKQS